MLKRKNRLTRQRDFRRLKRYGKSSRSSCFWLNWLFNGLPYSRFGFIATKKVGNAVQRNRAVRLLREVVRLNLDQIRPGVDMVFVAGRQMVGKKYGEVEGAVKAVLKKERLLTRNE